MKRMQRTSGLAIAAAWLLFFLASPTWAGDTQPTIEVYKTPTCGCCTKWIDSLRAAGFEVNATDMPDLTALKAMNGVPRKLSSCHTAIVSGYVVEGHVPAADLKRLLEEKPAVAGLSVPGMPLGSPGMEHPDSSRHEAYDVLAFGPDGVSVFASHAP
jgi:hypothetical protein